VVVFDTLPICGHTTDGYLTLALSEKYCGRREIWKDHKGHDAPCDRDGPEDQEHVHPLLEAGGDMSDGIANQTAEHGGDAIGTIVAFKPKRLLGGSVAHGHD
jgi:hypothetical protein